MCIRDRAKGTAKGRKTDSEREGGEGSVKIDLDPAARAEGSCIIEGARPGVDGLYRIVSVTHSLTRSGGSETSLELKQPQGDAGKDKRKAKLPSGGDSASSAAARQGAAITADPYATL